MIIWIIVPVVGLIAFIFGMSSGRKTATAIFKSSGATVFDAKQNYMGAVNEFIRNEAIFEILKWINKDINQKSTNGTLSFAETIKDAAAITNQVSAMTSIIYIKMGSNIKNAFYRVYETDISEDGEDVQLIKYISRYLMFMLRRLTIDLTLELDRQRDKDFSSILKEYILSLENEIYNNNSIYVISSGGDSQTTTE